MSATSHYSWTKPDIGGSNGTWGTSLNTDLDSIDTTVFAVSTAADAAQADADNAQASADTAIAGKLTLTPSTATVTGSQPNFATSIDFSVGGPVYFADFGTVNLGPSGSDFVVTFTNRPVGTGRIVWLHCKIVNSGSPIAVSMTTKVASGVSGWVLPFNTAMYSSTATTATAVTCTIAGDNITQWVVPFYILGS